MLKRSLIKLLLISLVVLSTSFHAMATEHVVVLHGILRSSKHMKPLAKQLEQAGYVVHNLDYPSTEHTIGCLAEQLHETIISNTQSVQKVHFVGYSMGGLVLRAYLNQHKPNNLGYVLHLATPNKGSEVADWLQQNWLYQKFYGIAGQELTTDQSDHLQNTLGTINYPLGVIAGNSSIEPISSHKIPGDDDGKVSIESTKIQGMQDHIVVGASHTFFPSNQQVIAQTLHFLKQGVFKH